MIVYKNIKTQNPDIDVHTTYTHQDSKTILRGYAIDGNTGIKLDGAKTHKRTASCDADIPRAECHLVAAVMAALESSISHPTARRTSITPGELDPQNAMVQAFVLLMESNDPITSDWNSDTRHRRLHYFKCHILPHLQLYVKDEFIQSDLALLRQELLDNILRSGKSKGISNMAVKTTDRNLSSAAVIYARMRDYTPDLPDIALAPVRRAKSADLEPPKYIPEVVRQRIYRRLEALVTTDPKHVYGTVLMIDGGLRSGEAAGTYPCDITIRDNSAYVSVAWQEHAGKRIGRLKTDSAYRTVPLSHWGTVMIQRCVDCIGDDFFTDPEMPLIRAQDLSAWILRLLRECGCNDAYLSAAGDDMCAHPDRNADNTPIHDLAAHICRRDRTERWRNICGLTCNPDGDSEIDALLGHITPHKRRKYDYRLPDVQAKIAAKLERYVYSVEISKHPAISPIGVIPGNDIDIIPYDRTRIRNDSDIPIVVRYDVTAAEPIDGIVIRTPVNSTYTSPTPRYISNKGERIARPIIGTNRPDDNNNIKED